MTLENFYLTATENLPASDLDRLSLCLGLTLEEVEELLAIDFLQPFHRLTFDNDEWRKAESVRESKRRYYESVKDCPRFRERERKRVAEARGRCFEPIVASGEPTALQQRLQANPLEAAYARRAA